MSAILKIAIASFLVTGASFAHAHSRAPEIVAADTQVKKEVSGVMLAQTFRSRVLRGGGRGLPPNPCRGRCAR